MVDSKKVEGVRDGGWNAAWVCCIVVTFISGRRLVGVAWGGLTSDLMQLNDKSSTLIHSRLKNEAVS